jgi:hypothetical protein
MKRIAIVDTYYPGFLKALRRSQKDYETMLRDTLTQSFGTADFYSEALSQFGWNCVDIIANDSELQHRGAFRTSFARILS